MVYQRVVFLILMIELNDLLQFLKLHGFPVNFWVVGENKTEDITDLVNNIRNAACHIRSPLRKFDPYELEYASNILGPGAMIHLIGPGVTYAISNKTVDDIGFAFGVRMIFAKADIGPAIAAARDRLYALGKANGFSTFGI